MNKLGKYGKHYKIMPILFGFVSIKIHLKK